MEQISKSGLGCVRAAGWVSEGKLGDEVEARRKRGGEGLGGLRGAGGWLLD